MHQQYILTFSIKKIYNKISTLFSLQDNYPGDTNFFFVWKHWYKEQPLSFVSKVHHANKNVFLSQCNKNIFFPSHSIGNVMAWLFIIVFYQHNLSVWGWVVFNATFTNILVLSWRTVLLVEETGVLKGMRLQFHIL